MTDNPDETKAVETGADTGAEAGATTRAAEAGATTGAATGAEVGAEAKADTGAAATGATAAAAKDGVHNCGRILVVDDEEAVESLLVQKFRRRIRTKQLEFVFAHDGQQALDILAKDCAVDMVLSDINMPIMDGLTLLGELRKKYGDLRAVIVSAYGDMSNIRTAMNRGAFDFVTKPIEFRDLEITIDKTLDDIFYRRNLENQKLAAEQAKSVLSRYFSPSILEQFDANPASMKLGAERRNVTLLFTDLADFTPLVENTEPERIIPVLNEYLDGVIHLVFEHGGTVMKIVGDSVRAMFGAPIEQEDMADRAIACALEIDVFAEDFKKRKQEEGLDFGITRIGINSGPCVVGNFGGDNFFEYTAYGDTVNIAARLELANKTFGTRICVSDVTAAASKTFQGRPMGSLLLKGKSNALQAHEALTPETYDAPARKAYEQAYRLMNDKDPEAGRAFAAYVGEYGSDPLATLHLQRMLAGESGAEIDMGK